MGSRTIASVCILSFGVAACSGHHGPDALPDASADTAPHLDGGSVVDATTDASMDVTPVEPDGLLRVLSMNLRNPVVEGDSGEDRLAIIANFVVERQPDFVALQEVTQRPDGRPAIDLLVEMTGYEAYWEITHRVPLSFNEGIGILARATFEDPVHHVLPHTELSGLLTRAVIGVQGSGVRFLATHLGALVGDAERGDQATEIRNWVPTLTSPGATFLLGDMNAEPDDAAMAILRGELSSGPSGIPFRDAWTVTHPEDPGFTVPADAPTRRIDYVYFLDDALVTPVTCETVFGDAQNGMRPSDHLGVLCAFDIAGD